MTDFLNALSLFWEFVNHPVWLPIILAVVGMAYFAVMYIKAERVTNKHRAEVQQKIVNNAYGEYVRHKYCAQNSSNEKTGS